MKELTPIEIKEWRAKTNAQYERMKELPISQPKPEAPKLSSQVIFEANGGPKNDTL